MSNEVAKVNNEVADFRVQSLTARAAEELKGLKLQYPMLKIPSGGALYFEVDDEPVKELAGVIIHHGPRNVYYATEFDGSSNPPDCSSKDGIVGFEKIPEENLVDGESEYIQKECVTCPLNQFGSDGRGKACKEKHQLYILVSDQVIPFSFLLPVSSTTPLNGYATRLFNRGKFLSQVLTSFTLEKATSKSGIVYSRLVLKKIRDLSEEEQTAVDARAIQLKRDVDNG